MHQLSGRRLWGLLMLLVAAQVWLAVGSRHLRSAIEEMPPPPSAQALRAMALGDTEFLYRHLGRWLEYVGDGGGRVRPLREYDYDRVVGWLEVVDDLDARRSDYIHVLAAQYFGQVSIDPTRVRKIVDYLRGVALADPVKNWRWLVWASHQARKPINDPALMKAIAHDFQSPELKDPSVPAWVRAMPIRLYRDAGDEADSRDAAQNLSPKDRAEIQAARDALLERIRKGLELGVVPEPQDSP